MFHKKIPCLLNENNNCKRPKKNNKIILIIGKSGSGKDSFKNIVLKLNQEECDKVSGCPCKKVVISKIKQITTRPIRIGEVPGDDYIFLTDQKDIDSFIENDSIFDLRVYTVLNNDASSNSWYYGIDPKDINISDQSYIIVGPSTSPIEWIKKYVTQYGSKNIVVVYIDSPNNDIFNRLLKRETSKNDENKNYAEMCRRYLDNVAEYTYMNESLEKLTKKYKIKLIHLYNNEVNHDDFVKRGTDLYQNIIDTIVK